MIKRHSNLARQLEKTAHNCQTCTIRAHLGHKTTFNNSMSMAQHANDECSWVCTPSSNMASNKILLSLQKGQGTRTVSLSDLICDDDSSSTSWLQEAAAAGRRVANSSRSELCKLLSLSPTASEAGAAQDGVGAAPLHIKQRSSGGRPQEQQQPAATAAPRQRTSSKQTAASAARASTSGGGAAAAGAAAAVKAKSAGGTAAGAAATSSGGGSAAQQTIALHKELAERKLVKCLKKLQQDKQRWVHMAVCACCRANTRVWVGVGAP